MVTTPGDDVRVIADFSAYPQWAMAVKKAEVVIPGADDRAERVRFSLDAGLVKDEYVLDYVWSLDGLTVACDCSRASCRRRSTALMCCNPSARQLKLRSVIGPLGCRVGPQPGHQPADPGGDGEQSQRCRHPLTEIHHIRQR